MCVPAVTQMIQHHLTHRASVDPMTHTGFGSSRLNKDKSAER